MPKFMMGQIKENITYGNVLVKKKKKKVFLLFFLSVSPSIFLTAK